MSVGVIGFIAIVAIANSIAFSAWRLGFVYVDKVVFKGFCTHIWALVTINALLLTHMWCDALINGASSVPVWGVVVCGVIACLTTIASGAFLLVGGKKELQNFYYTSLDTAPYFLAFFGLLFMCYIAPPLGDIWDAIINAMAVIGIILTLLFKVLPLQKIRFVTAPVVFDTGKGYSVVLVTNTKSVAKVEYEYEGRHFECWDAFLGKKEVSRIHGIFVPYEHLNCNAYSVSASRVDDHPAYGGRQSDTIQKSIGLFNESYAESPNFLVISGWHGNTVDWSSIKRRHENNAVLVLGDFAQALYSEGCAVKNFLKPCSIFSEGKIPVYLAVGNREHRGKYVREFFTRIGMEQTYYRFSVDEYNFTVIDSGEDKPDSSYELGGFSDGEKYLENELVWIRDEVEPYEGYNIVIAHSPNIMDINDYGTYASRLLKERGHSFLICGHRHTQSYISADDESNTTGLDTFVVGGCTKEERFVYSVVRFSDGVASIRGYSENGDCIAEYDEKLVPDSGEKFTISFE